MAHPPDVRPPQNLPELLLREIVGFPDLFHGGFLEDVWRLPLEFGHPPHLRGVVEQCPFLLADREEMVDFLERPSVRLRRRLLDPSVIVGIAHLVVEDRIRRDLPDGCNHQKRCQHGTNLLYFVVENEV